MKPIVHITGPPFRDQAEEDSFVKMLKDLKAEGYVVIVNTSLRYQDYEIRILTEEPSVQWSTDSNGVPELRIRHQDKSQDLKDVTVGRFVKMAKEKGLELKHGGGYLGNGESWEDYIIKPRPEP